MCVCTCSVTCHAWLFAILWTVARQAPLSMGFSRQGYWSGVPFLFPGDLPNPGIEPRSPAWQADSLSAKPQGKPKNTGVGSLSLLQRIFPTQGSNLHLLYLLHCRWILYHWATGEALKCYTGSIITELSFTTKVEDLLQKRCSDLKIKCILGKYSMTNPFAT